MLKAIAFRLAREEEKSLLEGLQRRASLANPGDREAILAHPEAIDLPIVQIQEKRVIVAEVSGAIVGFSVVLTRTDGQGELDGLFVEPTLWRMGVGRELVQKAGELIRNFGSNRLHVTGNPHALQFYLSVGFKLVGTTSTQFGPGLLLSKEL